MEIKQLVTFYTVAQELSFSQAATILNYAQPTITIHIQNLEQELGVQLFNRVGTQISLTAAGKNLMDYAERMIQIEGEARAVVTQLIDTPTGDLNICVSGSIMSYHIPPVLKQFTQDYPEVNIRLLPSLHCDIVQEVARGEADLGLVYRQSLPSTVDYIKLMNESLILAAGANHPLASEHKVIKPKHLEQHAMLFLSHTCPFRDAVDQIIAKAGIVVNTNYEFHEYDSIKQYLKNGTGVAVIPETVVKADMEHGEIVALDWFQNSLSVPIWVIWNRQRWMSPAIREFRNLVVDIMGQKLETPNTT